MRSRDPYLQAKYFTSLPLRNSKDDTIAHQNEHKKTEHPYHCRKNQQNIQANHMTVCASAREIMFGLCEIVVKIRMHSLLSEFSLIESYQPAQVPKLLELSLSRAGQLHRSSLLLLSLHRKNLQKSTWQNFQKSF